MSSPTWRNRGRLLLYFTGPTSNFRCCGHRQTARLNNAQWGPHKLASSSDFLLISNLATRHFKTDGPLPSCVGCLLARRVSEGDSWSQASSDLVWVSWVSGESRSESSFSLHHPEPSLGLWSLSRNANQIYPFFAPPLTHSINQVIFNK